MVTSTGNPVKHGSFLKILLEVITLPKQLALCKCAVYQKDNFIVTKGNNFADQAAKQAAQQSAELLVTDYCPQIPLDVLKTEQKAATITEQNKWLKCGAQLKDDLMVCDGKPILPESLHRTAVVVTHDVIHVSTGGKYSIDKQDNTHFYTINFETLAK